VRTRRSSQDAPKFCKPRQLNCSNRLERQRAVTEGNCMATAETSRILRFVASVPRLTFPPPPKPSLLGFQRAKVSPFRYLTNKLFGLIG
jgi:hypothetical protein